MQSELLDLVVDTAQFTALMVLAVGVYVWIMGGSE